MASISSIDEALSSGLAKRCACAFGVFDGLHRGHQHLLGLACEDARRRGVAAVALTFDIDPDEMFASGTLRKLQSNEQRLESIARSGVDSVVVLPFTRELAQLDPGAFLDEVASRIDPSALYVGADFRFGAKAQGTVDTLRAWVARESRDTCVHAVSLLRIDGEPVTSTRIRACLASGEIARANSLLGHAFELAGTVLHGRQQGRELGFPTANLQVPEPLRVLAEGVYAAYAEVDGHVLRAAASVGPSPVFVAQGAASCEVHLLDFDRDIYGSQLRVRFYERIRPMIAFESISELASTVRDNIAWVRDNMPKQEPRI